MEDNNFEENDVNQNDNVEQEFPKELTKKEKAEKASHDVAEVAARGLGRYFGGATGGAAVDAALKTKTGQKVLNKASKTVAHSPGMKRRLARSYGLVEKYKGTAHQIIDKMGTSSYESSDSDNNAAGSNSSDINGNGVVSGIWNKLSLKTKLVIIGVIAALVFVVIFLVVLITPLMELGIIEIEGIGGAEYFSNAYVNPTYSYCESINVEGQLYDLEEYVAGVVQAEVGAWLSDGVDEALKAQAIAARTYALYSTNGCKNPIANSQSAQTFKTPSQEAVSIANDTAGLVLAYDNDLFLSQYDSFCYNDNDCPDAIINADGSYTVTYTILPSGERHSITLSDTSYYNDIVPGGGHARGMSQLVSFQLAKEGNSYDEILGYFYSNGVEIVNLKRLSIGSESAEEGSGYIGTYTNLKSGKTYRNYKQYLYKGEEFTFDKKEKLANTGCGTTSAGIVLSGEDSSITPATLFIEAGYVNTMGGHLYNHYSNGIKDFNYCTSWNDGWCNATNNSTKLSNASTKEELINNLSSGGTAVLFISYKVDACLINNESWTQSQHFIVALDYDASNNTIYISNPGTNNSTKNGWISLDAFECVHISTLLYP